MSAQVTLKVHPFENDQKYNLPFDSLQTCFQQFCSTTGLFKLHKQTKLGWKQLSFIVFQRTFFRFEIIHHHSAFVGRTICKVM